MATLSRERSFRNKCRQKRRPSHGYCSSPLEEAEGWKRCNSYNIQGHTEELRLAKIAVKPLRYGSHTLRFIRFMGERDDPFE
jgi:hypothetical protein